jgi:acyl-CoA thioesterase-1
LLAVLRNWIHRCLFALCLLAAAGSATSSKPAILVVGDSLSAEYGLPRNTGWVSRLSERLAKEHSEYSVINASISGDTSSGGRARLPNLLRTTQAQIVVIELGGNDGLRGLDLDQMRDNLQAMIDACRAERAQVLLIGTRIPPNYGRSYSDRFFESFSALAHRNRIAYVPFLLEGFADRFDMFQPDHIHPGQQAQMRMLDNVWPSLRPLLRQPAT